MDAARVIVGADVAAASVTLALWQDGQIRPLGTVAQPQAGALPAALVAALPAGAAVRLVVEPTGGYERPLAQAAIAAGWEVWRPNPWQVRRWAQGQGVRAKTDGVDAQVLARYGAQGPGRPWLPAPAAIAALAHLLAAQQALATTQQQLANQRAAAARADAPAAVLAAFDHVQDQLDAEQGGLAQAISAHLAAQADLAAARARLLTVPGIGAKTVLPLLVVLASWDARTAGQGTAKQLTAFVGLDPCPYQSGTSVRAPARLSKQGDRRARVACYQSALGGIRGQNRLRAFYDGLRARGKPAKLALCACARKELLWAWAVYRSGKEFDAALTTTACAA